MNQLQVINRNGQLLVDSREVAEMVGKEHGHLLRDIKGYVDVLGKSNFGFSDFFIESTYVSPQNKVLPCYLITRKGCDMVANKMTGEKGILFTAEYVTRFDEMEHRLQSGVPVLTERQAVIQSLKLTAEIAEEMDEVKAITESHGKKIEEIEQKVDTQITLASGEQRRLQKAINSKVYSLTQDKEERSEYFRQLHREIKNRCQVTSYKDVLRTDLQKVLKYVEGWVPMPTK
ncbi:Rha family transcriptional regulator [Paenibacillus alvei]|uniref:Phage regulatory protein, rha family n=1 Tax=Paenibacillus alvei TaxID=44250 RepID=A0A383REG7_PAEAL|nr:Rha family transcriptional regulator [Paenibacillus alvei]SYX84656.1 Phage regulatory protein, rha family [Paenibacillus alvei]